MLIPDDYEPPTFGYSPVFQEGDEYMINRDHKYMGESYTVVATRSREAAEAAKRLLEVT